MDATTARLGLRLPPEARVWWAWRDGTVARPSPTAAHHEFTATGKQLLRLAQAVDRAEETARIVRDAGTPPGRLWWPTLLPVASTPHGALIVVDRAEPHAPVSTVYNLEFEGGILPRARSLGEMVTWWIEAVDCGAYDFDAATGRWIWNRDRLTTEQRARVVV